MMMKAGVPVPIHPSGPNRFPLLHEDDYVRHVEGLLALASVPATIVNWAGSEDTSIEALVRASRRADRPRAEAPAHREDARAAAARRLAARGEARPEPGALADGIRRMVEARNPELPEARLSAPWLSVVVPVFEERDNLEPLHRELDRGARGRARRRRVRVRGRRQPRRQRRSAARRSRSATNACGCSASRGTAGRRAALAAGFRPRAARWWRRSTPTSRTTRPTCRACSRRSTAPTS